VEVGRFARVSTAQEYALVVLSIDLFHNSRGRLELVDEMGADAID
jgi:hypothetical protein